MSLRSKKSRNCSRPLVLSRSASSMSSSVRVSWSTNGSSNPPKSGLKHRWNVRAQGVDVVRDLVVKLPGGHRHFPGEHHGTAFQQRRLCFPCCTGDSPTVPNPHWRRRCGRTKSSQAGRPVAGADVAVPADGVGELAEPAVLLGDLEARQPQRRPLVDHHTRVGHGGSLPKLRWSVLAVKLDPNRFRSGLVHWGSNRTHGHRRRLGLGEEVDDAAPGDQLVAQFPAALVARGLQVLHRDADRRQLRRRRLAQELAVVEYPDLGQIPGVVARSS